MTELGLSLLAPEPDFFYKPLTVEEPFTHQPAERRELGPALAELGVELIRRHSRERLPEAHTSRPRDGDPARLRQARRLRRWTDAPGLSRRRDLLEPSDRPPVDDLIRTAQTSFGGTMTFVVPPATSWSLPLYELALLFRRRSEELGVWRSAPALCHAGTAPLGRLRHHRQRRRRRAVRGPPDLARDRRHARPGRGRARAALAPGSALGRR